MTIITSPVGSPEGNSQMSIIDSLKRLERVGEETSLTNQKLIQAAAELAGNIVEQFAAARTEDLNLDTSITRNEAGGPKSTGLHRYKIVKRQLVFSDYRDGLGYVALDRDNALEFSKDVAKGLLDRFEEILSNRLADAIDGLVILENAIVQTKRSK